MSHFRLYRLNTWHAGQIFSRRYFDICFFIFFPENKIWYFMQIVSYPEETISMKCQSLLSGKNKNTCNMINLSSAELVQRVTKINKMISHEISALFFLTVTKERCVSFILN